MKEWYVLGILGLSIACGGAKDPCSPQEGTFQITAVEESGDCPSSFTQTVQLGGSGSCVWAVSASFCSVQGTCVETFADGTVSTETVTGTIDGSDSYLKGEMSYAISSLGNTQSSPTTCNGIFHVVGYRQ